MDFTFQTLSQGTVKPVDQSPKRKGFPIQVPSNPEPERSSRNRSFGVEDEANAWAKKRKIKNIKKMGYRPSSSPYFSTSKKPSPCIKIDKTSK